MSDIKPQFKGNVGVFLVCAELSKLNLIAMPTSRNTKGYDIMVMNPETNKAVGVQVKCTDKKDFPILSSHWKDYEQKIDERIVCDFIFVDISDLNKPNYFIVPQKEFKSLLKSRTKNYCGDYAKRHHLSWEGMLEFEQRKPRKPDLWSIELVYIETYKDKWGPIIDALRIPT